MTHNQCICGFCAQFFACRQIIRLPCLRRDFAITRRVGTINIGEVLAKMVEDAMRAIGDLPAMHWNAEGYAFVRPVRGLIMLLGKRIISGEVMGAKSGRITRGHPALANRNITITNAEQYEETLQAANVIADINKRESVITKQATAADMVCFRFGGKGGFDNDQKRQSFADAAAICEYPKVYRCATDKAFWQLPQECVASCLIKHQKCLPFCTHENDEADGKTKFTLSGFFFVADNAPKNPQNIIDGVNAVVRARLRDVAFYLQTDEKMNEQTAQEKLDGIVYHRKLGSQKGRAKRIAKLAAAIGGIVNLNADDNAKLQRAAEVCKLDLPTMMIGEYPELAGKIAALYFCRKDKMTAAVVERHGDNDFVFYENDNAALSSVALFLADKLEKIFGMFMIGEKPAGRRDPHGLRRAAGQITDILAPMKPDMPGEMPGDIVERINKISLTELLNITRDIFAEEFNKQNADIGEVREFIVRRISLPAINAEVINAVYALRPDPIAEIPRRCAALQNFLQHPQASVLIAANKRINNILRKSPPPPNAVFADKLLHEDAEKALHKCIINLEEKTKQLIKSGDYENALTQLANAADPIGAFFDSCMVNAEDAAIRANRLALLNRLRTQLNIVADLALL